MVSQKGQYFNAFCDRVCAELDDSARLVGGSQPNRTNSGRKGGHAPLRVASLPIGHSSEPQPAQPCAGVVDVVMPAAAEVRTALLHLVESGKKLAEEAGHPPGQQLVEMGTAMAHPERQPPVWQIIVQAVLGWRRSLDAFGRPLRCP